MRKLIIIMIAILFTLSLYIYTLAQETTSIQEGTPTVYPTRRGYNTDAFPVNLYCEDIEAISEGPSWGEITIGVSEVSDLETYIPQIGDYRVTRYADFISFYPFESEVTYPLINACIDIETQRITVLKISINGLANIDDFVAIYGEPDAVTWGNNNISRTVFWFEEGIALSVVILEDSNVLDFGEVGLLIFFPFQPTENYEELWPYNQTNQENPAGGDRVYDPPPSEEQNPFNFDAMIATVTAQPSRTPTPTFIPPPTATSTATP